MLRLRDVQIENRDLSHLCLLQMDPLDNPPPVPGIQPYIEIKIQMNMNVRFQIIKLMNDKESYK